MRATLRISLVPLLLALTAFAQDRREPVINDRFPVHDGSRLSPPIVDPVGECAKKVHVRGFIPHAIVRVLVNGTQAGIANPYFDSADISVSPALNLGDTVTATQTVQGITSAPSTVPVVVGPYPATLNKPNVVEPMYACGRVVDVDNLNSGTVVEVFRNGDPNSIGNSDVTGPGAAVFTASLNQGDQITAIQTACPNDPVKRKQSATSDPKIVQPDPNPMVPPTPWSYPAGADTIVLDGLYIGSLDDVLDNGSPVGSGFSNASANKFGINPVASSTSSISGSQKLCTQSGPGPKVHPSGTLGTPVIVAPLCPGQPYVNVSNTYPNSVLVLLRNGVVSGMAGGDLGVVQMALGNNDTFALGDQVQVLQYVGNVVSASSVAAFANCSAQNVITQHNDNNRSGANLAEQVLRPSNLHAPAFGFLYSRNVEGDTVSQPLYVHGVRTSSGVKNLIIVTTSLNNIYAFDASNRDPNAGSAATIWQRNLCSSVHSGVCSETASGFVGITSTPVIDVLTQTMYVVARCSNGSGGPLDGAIFIYAINIADGAIRMGPVQIQATNPNAPHDAFNFRCQRNRPGLLLSKGIVYAAFATFSCDAGCGPSGSNNPPYRGWVLGYRASDLGQAAVFATSGTGGGQVGIWQTGNGLAAAADGSIFFETGNGPSAEPLQDSFVKLIPTNSSPGLALANSFHPNNAFNAPPNPWAVGTGPRNSLNVGDTDLGSGGPMLLPSGRLIGGGKQGRYYVLDQGNMSLTQDARPLSQGFDGFQAFINTYHNVSDPQHPECPSAPPAAGCDWTANSGQCYINPTRYGDGELCGPNIHGGPIYWQRDANTGTIYEMPEKDFLKGFSYDLPSGHVNTTPALQASGPYAKPPQDGMPGGYSSLSANGARDGIVWTSLPDGDGQWVAVRGILAAFDANTLGELWEDADTVTFAKSVPPTIADGLVIRATANNQVWVYGLHTRPFPFPRPWPLDRCYAITEKYRNYGAQTSILGKPIGEEKSVGDGRGGRFRDFEGALPGVPNTVISEKARPGLRMPTCSEPPGKERTIVHSRIYWNKDICAHTVTGQILKLYLRLGGPKGKLGYAVQDESFSPDHYGRISRFEHGEIIWHADKGAQVIYKELSRGNDHGEVKPDQQ